jgi:hypothetical protein
MKDDDELCLLPSQTGGKPVIYLQPPRPITGATVTLSLCPEWEFSATYPVPNPWTRTRRASSRTRLRGASSRISWEAQPLPPRPPTAPIAAAAFSPAAPSLTPANAALLPFDAFLAHLDTALGALGLHVAARTDFVTYWLSAFVRIRAARRVPLPPAGRVRARGAARGRARAGRRDARVPALRRPRCGRVRRLGGCGRAGARRGLEDRRRRDGRRV